MGRFSKTQSFVRCGLWSGALFCGLVGGVTLSGCEFFGGETQPDAAASVPYEELEKIIHMESVPIPLADGSATLVLARLPEDDFSKVYRLNHSSGVYTVDYAPSEPLAGFVSDSVGKRFFVYRDGGGDENTGIYEYLPEQKTIRPFFVRSGAQSRIVGFHPELKAAYIRSNFQNRAVFSIYRVDLRTQEVRRLSDGKYSYDSALISPKEDWALWSESFGNSEDRITWVSLARPHKRKEILWRPGTSYELAFVHPNGNEVAVNSNEGRDRMGCARIALDQPEQLIWIRSEKGKDLRCHFDSATATSWILESGAGRWKVRLFDGVFEKEWQIPLPGGASLQDVQVRPSVGKVFGLLSAANTPGAYVRFGLKSNAKPSLEVLSKLNRSKVIGESDFAVGEDFWFESFDGKKIQGVLFQKKEWREEAHKHPLVVWIHGGPDSVAAHAFWEPIQYLVLNGFVVFTPNYRGSAGFGKRFETLNDRDWGGGHIQDVVWGKRAVGELPFVDGKKAFVVGRSFGGFSVLSALTQFPDEFQGGVAIVAIGNLFSFLNSIPKDAAWQNEFLSEVGDPKKYKKLLEERSPFFHVDRITA